VLQGGIWGDGSGARHIAGGRIAVKLYWHIVFLSIRACSLAAGFGGLERLFLLSRLMM